VLARFSSCPDVACSGALPASPVHSPRDREEEPYAPSVAYQLAAVCADVLEALLVLVVPRAPLAHQLAAVCADVLEALLVLVVLRAPLAHQLSAVCARRRGVLPGLVQP
jgi:hypothetical protein